MNPRSPSGARSRIDSTLRHLRQAITDTPLDTIRAAHHARRELDRISVAAVAEALVRSGGFARRNRVVMTTQISDLLGIDRSEARRFVIAAVHLSIEVTANGTTIPPRLPATADGFATGTLGLRHVQVIVTLLHSRPAERLSASTWADVESQLASQAELSTPAELRNWGRQLLVRTLPAPEDSDDGQPRKVTNELTFTPHLDRPGGTITARLDDAEMFSAITRFIDTHAESQASGSSITMAQRRARVLSRFCAEALRRRPAGRRDEATIRLDVNRKRRDRKRNARRTRTSHRNKGASNAR